MSIDKATTLDISVQNKVAIVRLDGAHVLNALHSSTHRALAKALLEFETRPDVGAVVICGEGRAFSSGADIREIRGLSVEDTYGYIRLAYSTMNAIAGFPKPVIAAIQGFCIGGGIELALACDLRVASTDALFSFREIALGSIPGAGGLQRLPAVVGVGVARDWILSGRDIGATEAYDRGLVTRLVSPDDLLPEALELGRVLGGRSGVALWLAKVALDPEPTGDRSATAAFQMLASVATHSEPGYAEATRQFAASGGDEGG